MKVHVHTPPSGGRNYTIQLSAEDMKEAALLTQMGMNTSETNTYTCTTNGTFNAYIDLKRHSNYRTSVRSFRSKK